MTRADPFDELAALFLTEGDEVTDGPGPPPPTARSTFVELLLVGHLPVRAGLWLTPYADAVARHRGPTALVRIEDEEPILQVLRGPRQLLGDAGADVSLMEAVRTLRPSVSTWIVAPGKGDLEQLFTAGANRITILTSADQAAVVAAYRLIKQLAVASSQGSPPLPAIGLAVVGANEEETEQVLNRLSQTTAAFLGIDLQLVISLPRMDAGIVATDYRRFAPERVSVTEIVRCITGPGASPAADEVTDPLQSAVRTDPRGRPEPPEPPPALEPDIEREGATGEAGAPDIEERARRQPVVPLAHELAGASEPEDGPPPAVSRASMGSRVTTSPEAPPQRPSTSGSHPPSSRSAPAPHPLPPRRSAPAGPPPPPAQAGWPVEPKQYGASPREPEQEGRPVELSTFVEGLTALPVRCPAHERVELAVDASGRLHLLAHEESLRELAVVRTWAHAHRELIAMACSDHQVDGRRPAQVHVFAREPLAVSDLHGSDMLLHVLAPVQVDGKTGWYAAPLNRLTP